jgi:hypothetical protein
MQFKFSGFEYLPDYTASHLQGVTTINHCIDYSDLHHAGGKYELFTK